MDGREIRMGRIYDRKSGNFLIVPMDHGVTVGPIEGLTDARSAVNRVVEGGATSVVLHKGIAPEALSEMGGSIGFIMHISASTRCGPDPNAKVLVGSVEEALIAGADAVSIHVNIGSETEMEMLRDMGAVSRECRRWNMPLLVMIYSRGANIENEHDPEAIRHAARIGAELGADVVKTHYTGSIETFSEVTKGCPVPVVIAGGPRMDTDWEVLSMIRDSLDAGGRGVSIGRNTFQHDDPEAMVRAIRRIVIDNDDLEDVSRDLEGTSG
jgi:fructose-bisphosphate aldolase/2-amino-3,7-dideoxy-D-threo-hept-6-ulosonate synthase